MKRLFFILIILPTLCWTACIDVIDFDKGGEIDQFPLVIDGQITLGGGPYQVKISRFNGINTDPVNIGEVSLLTGSGEKEVFFLIGEGIYEVPGEFIQGKVGETYQLEVLLNSQRYLSRPEIMPEPSKITGFSFELVDKEFPVTGGILVQKHVDMSIDASLPNSENGPFIRWQMEEMWRLTETQSPNPLSRPLTCYFHEAYEPQSIVLFNGNKVLARELEGFFLVSRLVDWAFGEKFVLTVFQSNMTESAFNYWQDVDLVVNQNGSIFDAPPAVVPGNIYNTEDSLEVVLGHFSAVTIDTARFPIYKPDLSPYRVVLRCLPSWMDYSFGGRMPIECFNCLSLDGASIVRPEGF